MLSLAGKRIGKHATLEVSERQKAISELKLRGLTTSEIFKQLPDLGIVDKKTGKPWSIATISKDIEEITFEWRKHSRQTIGEHKAKILAELQAVKAAAWAEDKLGTVLAAIEKECKILGLNSPEMLALVQASDSDLTREKAKRMLHELADKILRLKKQQEAAPVIAGNSNVVLEGKVNQGSTA